MESVQDQTQVQAQDQLKGVRASDQTARDMQGSGCELELGWGGVGPSSGRGGPKGGNAEV